MKLKKIFEHWMNLDHIQYLQDLTGSVDCVKGYCTWVAFGGEELNGLRIDGHSCDEVAKEILKVIS